jgi:endonuclease/exonuclease/phosphatase family metal-dependent hydrolase
MTQATLTIISHNAFWMQGVPFEGKNPVGVTAGVIDVLVELYRAQRPDLICLQEIHTPQVAGQIADALEMRVHHTPGDRQPAYGGAVLWRPDAAVSVRDHRDRGDLSCFRVWQQITWAGRDRSLRLTNVHLPSRAAVNRQPVAHIQQDELRQQLASGFDSQVILGDFNAAPDSETAAVLRQAGYCDSAVLAGKTDLPSSAGGKRVDQAWLAGQFTARLRHYDVIDLRNETWRPRCDHKTQASDHFPLRLVVEPATEPPAS